MRRTFLLLLGAFPAAFSRALSSSDASPLPIEIRSAHRVDKQEDARPIEYLIERGKRGLALVAAPQQSQDFLPQLRNNYVVTNLNAVQWRRNDGVGEDVPWMSFFQKYGFEDDNGWKGVWVHSKGYMKAWIVNLSIARSTKHGKDVVCIIAHSRFASNDANRYAIKNNVHVVDPQTLKDVALPPQEVAAKAVPTAQLVYIAAKQTKMLDSAPEKYFLVCDNVINQEAHVALDTACAKMGKARNDKFTLRADAPGVEGEMFKLVVGTDPTYSWLHTIGRNPEIFGGYRINSLEVRTYVYMVVIELVKK
ncbi:hypothetical protein HYFRA_00000617 [Hymenoscyphus fraxineus]|uniref:Uncharacterized protein n=1 Tax=Hymenoscyphus fraxineus TaxID=746836 RepID=A0A9N9L661_9HELO|nr:hypothetical protein HYFRA_00000617 [Hymenoscyphus fraxineus]